MAACFLAMALLPSLDMANLFLMRCCFTGATVFSGLNAVGIVKSTQQVGGTLELGYGIWIIAWIQVSRHLSHALFAWNTLMLSVIMLSVPFLFCCWS